MALRTIPIRSVAAVAAAMTLAAACGTDGPAASPSVTAPSVTAPSTSEAPTRTTAADAADDAALPATAVTYLDELESTDFSGVVVVKQAGETTTRAYGYADPVAETEMAADTVLDIGSITKQFTGAAILRLEMDGALSVDDRVGDHLDGLPDVYADVTLHELLIHTSGLPDGLGDDYAPVDFDDFAALVAAQDPLTEAGTTFIYSNPGYSLLAAVVEQTSGLGYEAYLRANLFEPAGMLDTGYVIPDWPANRVAVGIDPETGESLERPNELPWADDGPYWHLLGNGGILSTAGDMARWHEALLGDEILDAAAKEKYFGRQIEEGAGATTFYGYGWAIFPGPDDGTLITHNGGNGIFFADFLWFVEEDLMIYMATNQATLDNELVGFALADSMLGTSYAAMMDAGNADACGFSDIDFERPPDREQLEKLPDNESGSAAQALVDILLDSDGDDAARLAFANDHIHPSMVNGAPPDVIAGELVGLQREFEPLEITGLQQSAPNHFHVLWAGPDDEVMLSVGTSPDEPSEIICLDILYK